MIRFARCGSRSTTASLPGARQGLCSKGFHRKTGGFKPNPLGVPLAGCPLEEKIGEAHALRGQGDSLGALADRAVDNPMCPGTGHRICNDCMKACIFQKQEPVNIPQVETGVLTDVLAAALGLRDLRPADALESAQLDAAAIRCPTTARTCWWSASVRPATRSPTTSSTRASASSPSTA